MANFGNFLQGFNQTFWPRAQQSFEEWRKKREAQKLPDPQRLREAVKAEGTNTLIDNLVTGRGIFSKIGVPFANLSREQRKALLEQYRGVFEGRPAAFAMAKYLADTLPEPEKPYVPTGKATSAAEAEAWAKEAMPEPDLTSALAEALSKGYTSEGRIKPIEERIQPGTLTPEPGGFEAAMTPETRRKLAEPMPSLEVTEGEYKGYPRWAVSGGLYIPMGSPVEKPVRERLINAFPKGVSREDLTAEEREFADWVLYGPQKFTARQIENLPPGITNLPPIYLPKDPQMRTWLFSLYWQVAPTDKVMRYIYDQIQRPEMGGQNIAGELPEGTKPLTEGQPARFIKDWQEYLDQLLSRG